MDRQQQNKECENKWAQMFLDFINFKHGFDYISAPSPCNSSADDIRGISKTNKFENVILELTEAKKFCPKEINLTTTDIKNGIKFFNNNQVQNVIDNKIKKYYKNNTNVINVILLIQGYLGKDWMKDDLDKLRSKNIRAPFKGIYYIYPGDTTSKAFTVEIKKCF